jgi:HAD superfamily hydrolase (TIGR01549 family)
MSKLNVPIDSFQAILFDFDGVLAECMDVKTEAFAQMYEPYGEDVVKKVVKHHVENGGISRYRKIKYYHENYLNTQLSDDEIEELAQVFSNLVVEKVIKSEWVGGAKEFLDKYHATVDMYVISGTPEPELKSIVDKRDMKKYFKGVYGSPITKPEHIKRIISENDYDSKKVLYVGDSISDYNDAIKAQVPFLGRVQEGLETPFPNDPPVITNFFELV